MSEENVEVVMRQFEAFSAGDLDAWAQAWDRNVVVDAPKGWPEGTREVGLDAWRRQVERLRDSWEEARVEVDHIRPVGSDRVVMRIRYVTRGRDPGMSFDTPMAASFVLRDRKITRAEYFWDFAEALKAAGLSE
jgi:ketosteroid isomerase-like protein